MKAPCFKMQAEFHTNPRLHNYARQVLWLSAVVPIFAVLLVKPAYTLVSSMPLDWFLICISWLIGLVGWSLVVASYKELSRLISSPNLS
ncbi:hypothetical protein H6H02_07050 [Coleofasciculus sp. FACHB-1120]|nr:hypothetical protein [Coleofasciculus sp. FACHB-1120]